MPTISQVAKAARVSKATVSRVFSAPERVNANTRDAVMAVANELGYRPAPRNRVFQSTKAGSIGLVVPDIVNPFFPPMIKAVQRRARSLGFAVFLADSDAHPSEEAEAALAMSKQVDGLIFWSSRLSSDELKEITDRVPTVLVNRGVSGVPTIVASSKDGMRQAVEHLYVLGHERCCYVNAPRTVWSNQHRRAGVREACKALGMELVEVGPFADTYEGGVQAADVVAATGVTAAIASNDLAAIGIVQQLSNRGLEVPRDISVIGVDDTTLAMLSRPQLTSVRIPVDEIGALAVDFLVGVLRSAGPAATSDVEVGTRLIVRGSTGPATSHVTWSTRLLRS